MRTDDDTWLQGLETPCYLFDPARVLANLARLREALGTRLVVSLKANPDPDLYVRCGHAFTDGVELASQGELDIVVGRGQVPRYLNNPSMSDAFIAAGLASRCVFIVDGSDMAERLIRLADTGSTLPVLLRINAAALLAGRAPRAWHDHFGMTPAEALAVAARLRAGGLAVGGLHTFVGSNGFRSAPAAPGVGDSADLAFALADLAQRLEAAGQPPLNFLNLGGGFDEAGLDVDALGPYRARIAPLAARFTLAHEAGRALFASAGLFLTRVTAVKQWEDRVIAVCDGGMSHNFLLARTETALKNWRAPRLVPHADRADLLRTGIHLPIWFVGDTCNRADVIGRLEGAPAPRPGDLLVFDRCGAYHATYTVSGFLSHRPARVYIRQG